MKFMSIIQRIFKYYNVELFVGIIGTIIGIYYALDSDAYISMLFRKISLLSIGLVFTYIIRLIKIGPIEWFHPWDKIYTITLLLYCAIVLAFG